MILFLSQRDAFYNIVDKPILNVIFKYEFVIVIDRHFLNQLLQIAEIIVFLENQYEFILDSK